MKKLFIYAALLLSASAVKSQVEVTSTTYDLDPFKTEGIQHIGKDKWAIAVNYPVVVDSEDAVVFEGRTLSKKAKDSELVLIKVKK